MARLFSEVVEEHLVVMSQSGSDLSSKLAKGMKSICNLAIQVDLLFNSVATMCQISKTPGSKA